MVTVEISNMSIHTPISIDKTKYLSISQMSWTNVKKVIMIIDISTYTEYSPIIMRILMILYK